MKVTTRRRLKKNNAKKGRAFVDLCSGKIVEIRVRPFPEGHRATVYIDGKPSEACSHSTQVRGVGSSPPSQTYLPKVIRESMRWYDKLGGCVKHFSDRRSCEREQRKGRGTNNSNMEVNSEATGQN